MYKRQAKACDTNDDDSIDIADAICILAFLFADGRLILPDGTPAQKSPGCIFVPFELLPSEMDGFPACEEPCSK